MNYNGKIDFKKFKNSALIDLKGKTATKRCICIPVKDNNLFVGEKGVYFDFILREIAEDKRQYGNTHIICPNIPKEKFEKMTEEEKKAQPILGQIKEYQAAQMQATAEVAPEDNSDLPF